ncbi:major facilitator superfamily domain-containing protein 8-like [Uranotaenia lowii]|uniref:major facilitator superfamily domain-containing protein 8-like n=1 Tax=Uranotaenia lowii TaxID=190385 RepID=UPI002479854C|nr:major facilitator superfamily domain-containing protein 8-like [Uranotaenia lowii]
MAPSTNFWKTQQKESDRTLGLETEEECRKRWISIRIIYFNGFLVYLAFSIIGTSVWPYLNSVDPDAGKVFLTYVFAIPSLMQLVCSPLFGWWNNKLSSIRMPMALFLILFIIGQIMYSTVEEFPVHRKYVMLTARALVGISSVCCTIYRAYVSSATTVAERTMTMSILSLAQTLGILAGSVFQSLFAIFGEEGYRVLGLFRLNMYTASGWFCAVLGVVNLVLMLPSIFQDQLIAVKEAMKGLGVTDKKDVYKTLELQHLAILLMLVAFALLMFVYSGYQT